MVLRVPQAKREEMPAMGTMLVVAASTWQAALCPSKMMSSAIIWLVAGLAAAAGLAATSMPPNRVRPNPALPAD